MERRITQQITKFLFYRNDIISKINHKIMPIKFEINPTVLEKKFRTTKLTNFIQEHINQHPIPKKENISHSLADSVKDIISEDDLVRLQEIMVEKQLDFNFSVSDEFFDKKDMSLPILHFSIMKHSLRCFKFLLLNGSNPLIKIDEEWQGFGWDCRGIAGAFGEQEILTIFSENMVPWDSQIIEGCGLSLRNKYLYKSLKSIVNGMEQEKVTRILNFVIKSDNYEGFAAVFNDIWKKIPLKDIKFFKIMLI